VQQWEEDWHHSKVKHIEFEPYIAAQAAAWGADMELEACCNLLTKQGFDVVDDLRAARRPKPPSLKERLSKAITDGDEREALKLLEELDDSL
jgi:hypothetical protein